MPAARLHGAADLRVDDLPHPGDPPFGQALVRVEAVGICGSDLHTYRCGVIGDTHLAGPIVMGHEFGGVVELVGADSLDGNGKPLQPGVRVAVDPAQPCGRCEWCRRGDSNLCPHIVFCGLSPYDGAMRPWMHVPANTCYPVPDGMDAVTAAMLEPFGVAIHTLDLAKLRPAESVAVIGAGSIGLCILQLLVSGHARPVFAADKLPWRVALAEQFGAQAWRTEKTDVARAVLDATAGRGVDVAIEAASGGDALFQAAEMLAPGGRLMAVGIDEDDRLVVRHSNARRKGITVRMVRRMKHAYGRAIRLVEQGDFDLAALVTHRFPLDQAPRAFALNANYDDGVVKAMIEI
jgi:L-iditol 2-dehydrogenase